MENSGNKGHRLWAGRKGDLLVRFSKIVGRTVDFSADNGEPHVLVYPDENGDFKMVPRSAKEQVEAEAYFAQC